jgi:sugar-specific transcriptional regulator TrmB
MVDERLKNILTRNGLSEKQALVFLACLEGGQMTISQVATLANLKRSITYKVVESLIKDGYLSEIFGEKVRIFQANDPIRILRTVENNTDDLKFFIPILKGIFQKHDLKPKVEFYDGKDGIRAIFRTFG